MPPEFELIGYLRLLAEAQVAYLIVGGVAARLQGAATTTQDIDIMPEPSWENLARLAVALSTPQTQKKDSNAASYEAHPTVDSMEFRTADVCSYRTAYGVLDVLMDLPGVGGYDIVVRGARSYEWSGIVLLVANLDDIITSKETADRAKDRRALDALNDARERLRQKPDPYELRTEVLDMTDPTDDQG
jgi:hypothetical protein